MQILRAFFQGELAGRIELDPTEAQHLVRVRRARDGQRVTVFNEKAQFAEGAVFIEGKGKKERCFIDLDTPTTQFPPPASSITLIQALPKGKDMDELVRRATEVGVAAIYPVITEHVEKQVDTAKQLERWHRIAIEAAKQSGNLILPKIHTPCSLADALASFQGKILVASLEADASSLSEATLSPGHYAICVGPEGDFSPTEYQLLRESRALGIRLARHVLRVQTAALYAISILDYELQRLNK